MISRSLRTSVGLALVLTSTCIGGSAAAQDPGPPPQGRGLAMRDGMLDFGLLRMPAVREALNLTEAQRGKLDAAEPPFDGPGLDLKSILDERQLARLAQIRLQAQGPRALLSESLGTKLSIDAGQRKRLEALAPEGDRMFMPPEEEGKLLASMLEVLTKEQRATYDSLIGTKVALEFGPGMGGPGMGGPGGMGGGDRKLVKEFDKDGDKRLDRAERDAAREKLKEERANGGGRRRMGPPPGMGGMGGAEEEAKPGIKIAPSDVTPATGAFYDPGTLRTLFFDFADEDWLKEMGDFYGTDVEVPATLTVDGKQYKDVGVSYRGASSYFTVGEAQKRSLSVSVDFAHEDQRLLGYKSLNLLNAHEDPSLLRSVLYLAIAGAYIPTPKANVVRVVINGENWGVYSNAQQFNKEFVREHFTTDGGARWKVSGSPQARGGLEYTGDDIEQYKRRFEIKSKDDEKSWLALINLCKTLNETPIEELEAALAPILDIEGTLRFLAIDNALVNNDGYWVRASDYNLYLDEKGVFHLIPHDANETFGMSGGGGPGGGGPGGGPGGGEGPRGRGPNVEVASAQDGPPNGPPEGGRRGGRRGGGGGMRLGGPTLDPLVGLDDASKPLRSRLLKVPSLQRRYLEHVREIAMVWLDWDGKFGKLVKGYHALIKNEVERDTKKLSSTEAFDRQLEASPKAPEPDEGRQQPRRRGTLRDFADQRRAFLLSHPAIQALGSGAATTK